MSIGFIIQARLGSTRLPNKVIKPFYNSKNILEILIGKLKKRYPTDKIIIATTTSKSDDDIKEIATSFDLPCFRGSENNVLNRFIEAAEQYNIDQVFRVCADNPFIDENCFADLLEASEKGQFDYVGFSVNGIPSVKTHFGFWGEYVSLAALKKTALLTQDSLYEEHVTNYIYANPDLFKLGWVEVNESIANRHDIRLTVDTEEDFNSLSKLYISLVNENIPFSPELIVAYIDKYPDLKEKMMNEIQRNTK